MKKLVLIYSCILVASIAMAAVISCGGGGGGGSAGKVAVVGDHNGDELAVFLRSQGVTVDNYDGRPDSSSVRISGDYVVWEDSRMPGYGDQAIYGYRVSTAEQFVITDDSYIPYGVVIDGDYVAWGDNRNSAVSQQDIYAYQISTDTIFPVTTAPGWQYFPQVCGDYIVWEDNRNEGTTGWDIYAYKISTGTEFPVTTDSGFQLGPRCNGNIIIWQGSSNLYAFSTSTSTQFTVVSGGVTTQRDEIDINEDYIVWTDTRDQGANGFDIYAYELSTGNEIAIAVTTGNQRWPIVKGDYIVWTHSRNSDTSGIDIYAYQISTATEIPLVATEDQIGPDTDGEYIVWRDNRSVPVTGFDIYAYSISTATTFPVSADPGLQFLPRIDGGNIVWGDESKGYKDVFLSTQPGITKQNITPGKAILDVIANVGDYGMILLGDNLSTTTSLELFDAADAAGVNMLGSGTAETGEPLGYTLSSAGRFGMSYNDNDPGTPMEIEATLSGAGHSIFDGVNTSGVIPLENAGVSTGDLTVYFTDAGDPDSPGDWTILATMGPAMIFSNDPAIVEFTTPSGTRVILDGSANTSDEYDYWNQTRWDMLYNEVSYLID